MMTAFAVVTKCQVVIDGIHLFRCGRHALPGLVVCERHFADHDRLVTPVAVALITSSRFVAHRWVFR